MLRSMLIAFRQHYPQGGLVSELLRIHDGLYIVRAVVVVENQTLATGLAAHGVLETAEDKAYVRALGHLGLADIGDVAVPPSLAVPPTDAPAVHPSPKAPKPVLSVVLPTAVPEAGTGSPVVDPLPSLDLERESAAANVQPEIPATHGLASTSLDSNLTLLPQDDFSPNLLSIEPMLVEPTSATSDAPLPFEPDLLSLEGIPIPSIDLSDIIAQTDVELQRLGWNVNQGREFLEKTYGKRSRHDLTDEELLEFLLFLETQPTPGH